MAVSFRENIPLIVFICFLFAAQDVPAQEPLLLKHTPLGVFSLGLTSVAGFPQPMNKGDWYFGSGGQMRLQLSRSFVSEGELYFTRNRPDSNVSGTEVHLVPALQFYPIRRLMRVQPVISIAPGVAYHQLKILSDSDQQLSVWAASARAGLAAQINISPRFDLSIGGAYLVLYGKELSSAVSADTQETELSLSTEAAIRQRVQFFLSINYKLRDLW